MKNDSLKVIEYRKRRKLNLMKVLGNQCCLCGYHKIPEALEFHHIDPSKKLYNIANGGVCHDLKKDLDEIKKCVLVCANCHREIHCGFYTADELFKKQNYNDNIANQLQKEKQDLLTKKRYYCKECGKQISKQSQLCINCYHITRRKTDRPDREKLKQLIREKTFTQIGRMFNVSDNTIRKWCENQHLPKTKKEINSYSDDQWRKI